MADVAVRPTDDMGHGGLRALHDGADIVTGAELRAWREARGLSQSAFARMVGVRQPTVSRWETGQLQPPRFLALALERLDSEGSC